MRHYGNEQQGSLRVLPAAQHQVEPIQHIMFNSMDLKSRSHSVNRWQLNRTDCGERFMDTCFSAWTPLNHKQSNQQLFAERMSLVMHWFDMWTDSQRKHLLHSLLSCSNRSQIKFCRDFLMEILPVTHLNFTSVLPRFLSLHVMSFLSPRDLCAAAQVNWHWRVLAEQDCLWAGRCVRLGWFLPYTPAEKEFGAWKKHYVRCFSALESVSPREVRQEKQQHLDKMEEEKEKRMETMYRRMVREKLREDKRTSLRTRRPWGSSIRSVEDVTRLVQTGLSSSVATLTPTLSSTSTNPSLDVNETRMSVQASSIRKVSESLSSLIVRPAPEPTTRTIFYSHPVLLLLVSNMIPAYEMVLSGVQSGVIVVLYDHRGSLSALLAQVKRAICGQRAQRLGLLAPGGTEEMQILHNSILSEESVVTQSHRTFWLQIRGHVLPPGDGGGIDFFCPLAASATGLSLLQTLSTLTSLKVCAPMGLASGSFQNILGEWSDGSVCAGLSHDQPGGPALEYLCESVLQGWCYQAQWMEDALLEMRRILGSRLQCVSHEARGRALGHFLWREMSLEDLSESEDFSLALTKGLAALREYTVKKPVEFLADFLSRWKNDGWDRSKNVEGSVPSPLSSVRDAESEHHLDWRGVICRELHHSECVYVSRLNSILKEYRDPLRAALDSHRTILSTSDILVIFSPVTQVLQLHRTFVQELELRLLQWGAGQCVGDVCVKLCSQLKVYTNYFNNYTTALSTIDKCTEQKPLFRAFLKKTDRTLATHMMSLQELLLCPAWRIYEYVTLLQCLSLHTHHTHPDHMHLNSALTTLRQYKEFIHKLKQNSERVALIEETQQLIQGCPHLDEGSRQLLITQDAALFQSPDDNLPESLREYEQTSDISLFLFNDALLLTQRQVRHSPFTLSHQSTHTFLASVALSSLSARKVAYSRCPRRSWTCATETAHQRDHFLAVLESAIKSILS
ncbi:epithelial cell-transforming sequence 2 oncogene-like isoform 2-T3 [Synchiropus picturatus]